MHGETGRHLVCAPPFNPFHIIDLLLCPPKKREKGKRCCFNFSANILNDCYCCSLDVLTHLECLRDIKLVLLKFNFATKYKMLHLKGHGIYSHNFFHKSNVLLLSKE